MPLPDPEYLTLPEAVDRVASRCAVSRDAAEAFLERDIRDRELYLDDDGEALFPHELEGMTIDWRTGLVGTRMVGGGWQKRPLRIVRWLLDERIGPAAAKAAPRVIEQGAEAPSNAKTSPQSRFILRNLPEGLAAGDSAEIALHVRRGGGDNIDAAAAVLFFRPNISGLDLALAVSPSPRSKVRASLLQRGRRLRRDVEEKFGKFPESYR